MKISALFESYKIDYDFTKKKNQSSIIDFIKKNNIQATDIANAMDIVKKSSEYKKVISLSFAFKSTPLQEKRATMYFESDDGNTQITCYATGQARKASRGGFNNQQFIASPIPTLPPTQIGDKGSVVDVLVDNLKKSLQSVINSYERRDNKKLDGLSAVDERMKKFGFPEGFRIYLDGAEKNDKYISMDEGQVIIKANTARTTGLIVVDFGKNPELGPNVDIASAEGIWKVILRGENIKSYKGLEKIFESGMIALEIDTSNANFKELAKVMSGNNIKKIYFRTNPLEMPLLSLPKVCHNEVSISSKGSTKLLNDNNVKLVLEKINKVIRGDADILDVQDELLDRGFDKAAKQ